MATTETFAELSAFKQQIVYAVAANDGTPNQETALCPYGLRVKEQLEEWLDVDVVNHGRLYPNIDDLVNKGYVTKHEQDKRTNGLRLTDDAVDEVVAYHTDVTGAALQSLGVYGDVVPPEVAEAVAAEEVRGTQTGGL